MASKEISDLPAEIIDKINKLLPSLQDKKNFREVCLLSPQLRELYRDIIFHGDDDNVILHIHVDIRKEVGISAEDLQIVMNSSRNIKLTFHYFKSTNISYQQYKAAIVNFVDICNGRITQIEILFMPLCVWDLLQSILPKLTNVEKNFGPDKNLKSS